MDRSTAANIRRARALPTRICSTRRVVLISDRSIHSAALRAILDGEPDFAVDGIASTYAVAVHRARDLQPDLLVVDLAMHAMNERLLLRGLRMASGGSTIVVINGTGSAQDEAQALDDGADVYCDVNIGMTQLVELFRVVRPWGTPASAGA